MTNVRGFLVARRPKMGDNILKVVDKTVNVKDKKAQGTDSTKN